MIALLIAVTLALIFLVWAWVNGIHSMNEKHPDYKGEDLFGEDTSNKISNEIHPEEIWNDEKKEALKKFISEHKKH